MVKIHLEIHNNRRGIPPKKVQSQVFFFGAGGHEEVLFGTEVNERSRANRVTHSMAQTELLAMEQNARLTLFSPK